jgi:biotin operon repressor
MIRPKVTRKSYDEPIAREALAFIIKHELPAIELKGRDRNLAVLLRRLYGKLSKDGILNVTYGKKLRDKSGKEYGREYALLPISFQNLNRKIRNALVNHYIVTSGNLVVDIDVVNCHPELFLQLLEKHQIQSDRDLIAKYVSNRKAILEEVQRVYSCDRDTAKSLLLALINFGTVKGWAWKNEVEIPTGVESTEIHAFLTSYELQFRENVAQLMRVMPELVELSEQTLQKDMERDKELAEKLKDAHAYELARQKRFVHVLLTEGENQVLQAMIAHIEKKYKAVVIISKMYDGCIVQCKEDIDCHAIRCHVFQETGYLLSFEVKPFVSPIVIPTDLPPVEDDELDCDEDLVYEDRLLKKALLVMSNYNVAKLFHHCFPDSYAYTDAMSRWYCFKSPRWRCIQGNVSMIIRAIDDVIVPKMHDFISRLRDGVITVPSLMKLDSVAMRKELDLKMGSIKFKNDVVSQLCSFYQVDDPFRWISSLDANPDILGLDDCVYDLVEKRYRDGLPSDMVTMSCGHRRQAVEQYDEDIANRIYDAVNDIFDDKDMFHYVWSRLASCVSGRLPCDAFDIWTGRGRNGKGVIKALMASAFGNCDTGYYYEPDVLVFTTVRQNASGPCPELAKFKGKRCCMTSEGNNGDSLQLALLKRLTGGDVIQARDLNKSFMSVVPTFNLFLLFNVIPSINDTSNATKRRLRINEFPFEYVDEPKLPNEKKIDEGLRDLFASKEYGATALGVMLKWFGEYGHHEKPPPKVVNASRQFMLINDPLSEFMLCHFENGTEKDYVLVKNVMSVLKSDPNYRSQLGIRRNSELIQNLRNKGYEIPYTKMHGYDYIRGLKLRAEVEEKED